MVKSVNGLVMVILKVGHDIILLVLNLAGGCWDDYYGFVDPTCYPLVNVYSLRT